MDGNVDGRALEALGPEGVLVDPSSGMIVDEPALLDAFERRGIAGAGLDVILGGSRIDPRVAALENVVLQPHHGAARSRPAAPSASWFATTSRRFSPAGLPLTPVI